MISIIFDNYSYEIGVKTVVAGVLALLLGLLGFVVSIFALGIVRFFPAMRTQIPPYRKSNSVDRGVRKTHHDNPVILLDSKTPSLRRAASFPILHKLPASQERPFTNPGHVTFHVDSSKVDPASLAGSVNMNPSSPTVQRRRSHRSFPKRRSTCGESPSCSRTSSDERNLVMCNDRPPGGLPLKCSDARRGRRNSVACDEHGMINPPQVESLSEGTTSTRSSLTISLRLPSVRKAFSGIPRLANVPRRTSVTNISAKQHKQTSTLEFPDNISPSSPPSSTPGEVYRVEYVNPFKMKKPKIKPKLEALKSNRTSRFSFSPPWLSPKSAGLTPNTDLSTTSSTSTTKSPALGSLSSLSLEPPSPLSLSSPQMDVPQSKGSSILRSVPRTQPYGPPWNALMPGHELDLADIERSLRRQSEGY